MEATTEEKLESGKPTDGTQGQGQGAAASLTGQTGPATGGGLPSAGDGNPEANRSAEAVDQTKQVTPGAYETASQAVKGTYDKTIRTVNETSGLVKSYSRENPGTVTLIAFGAGIGIALLLYGSRNSRSRARRLVPPVIDVVRNVVLTLLR